MFLLLQMVRNNVRKPKRQNWSADSMKRVVLEAIANNVSLKKASAEFVVPKSTLARYVIKKRDAPDFQINKK